MTRRQTAFILAKITFACCVLACLFHKTNLSYVWSSVHDAHRIPIVIGIILCLITVVIAGWRWKRLLAMIGINAPVGQLICIAQIGQFFTLFLPGPAGDDLTRMLYISRIAKGRIAEACATVVIDRLIGLACTFVMAFLCIPWQWRVLALSHQTYWMALAMLGAGSLVSIFGTIFFMAGHPTHLWFEHRLRALPATSFRDELARIWGLLCINKSIVAQVICAAFVTQLLVCMIFYLAGLAVGIDVPLFVWMGFVPIVLAASAMPVTLAGLGVREYLFVLFLGIIAHVQREQALAASFVVLTIILTVASVGGILYIFYRPTAQTK